MNKSYVLWNTTQSNCENPFSHMLTLKAKPLDSVYKTAAWCSIVFEQCCYWLGTFLWKNKFRWRHNWKRLFWLIKQLFFSLNMTTRKGPFFNLAAPLATVSWLSYELWEMYLSYIPPNTFSLTDNTVTDILVIWKNRTPCNPELLKIQFWWVALLTYDTLQYDPYQRRVLLDQKKCQCFKGGIWRKASVLKISLVCIRRKDL